ncbi:AMP-binding protein [Pseudorhodoferax sp. Leaf265]|uniref:AMP-binding protein n=1 Tax=Pseudorhodoferax sp. Leaf265 TaxID=1736315 RepID=UPI0006F27044|nr:AMP-binding protein [Pseudorhodoferax sp. Leaf265]KQP21080.1 AMP-dependent synthetase [Pseudorhodoferax sp. Leaf265]
MQDTAGGAHAAFLEARDFLLAHRTDYERAVRDFAWPRLTHFNWALDHFDTMAEGNDAPALWIVEEDGREEQCSFAQMSRRSSSVANWLRGHGVQRGDRILLMLGNERCLWEAMLAAIKLGAVVIPATTLLSRDDLLDRFARGQVKHVIANADHVPKFADVPGGYTRIVAGGDAPGWLRLEHGYDAPAPFAPEAPTHVDDPLLLYFTSGTTSKPKLVLHSHQSYPVGHLSTMYWLGLQPGDVHLNISSPGWAKHAWSCFFAPWNAHACVMVYNYERFQARGLLDVLQSRGVTSLCAPPTVYRLLMQEDLAAWRVQLRELIGAGEPMNPEVIARFREAWGLQLRDGFGQTETTAQIGNTPGQPLKPGSMGRPLPGYRVQLLDADDQPASEGEIGLDLAAGPLGLMLGYADDAGRTAEVTRAGHYHTGDIASRDADGYITYVGRTDDVFKASDYRISPFELESVLIEHPAVAEGAVIPSFDPVRLAVPKAVVTLTAGHTPSEELARDILAFCRARLGPYKRIRKIEFAPLPKTISGKIRRAELRRLDEAGASDAGRLVFGE